MTAAAEVIPPQAMARVFAERMVRQARNRFHWFGPLVVQDAFGAPITYAAMHYAWMAHVNYAWSREKHAGIFAHMSSGKTSGFLLPLGCWLIGKNNKERIKVVCSGDDAAKQRVSAMRRIIESPMYSRIFPNVRIGDKWTEHMLYVERESGAIDPTLEAKGVFSKGVGSRATKLLFDDVCDLQNSTEQPSAERVNEYVEKQWLTRLEPMSMGGRALWIATPYQQFDASFARRSSPDFVWLEVRVKDDLTAYEQEVFNAGADYADEVAADILAMTEDAPFSS